MDELTKSTKHIDGKEVTTTYAYDLNGNKMEITSNGTFKRYHYNKDNQLTSILTEEGSTDIYYDKNGNMRDILYVGGAKEHYEYDDYGQLIKVTNDKDKSYTYSYDAQGDRIRYQKKYSEAYDNDIWYDALSQTSFEDAKDLLDDKNSDQILASLRYQSQYRRKHGKCVLMKEENWNESNGDDWENKNIAYILDKSVENAEVLATSTGEISIYGEGERLSTDSKTTDGIRRSIHYVNGNNNTVYGTATTENVWGDIRYRYKAIEYTDYGYTDDIKSGFSYNGEVQDETGLIYLRARYYNPVIGQFIQLDENRGEKTSIESQNRYTYALNNPNKYIDKNGQAAMMMNDGGSGRRKSGGIAGGGRISGKFDVIGAIGSFSKIVSNAAEDRKKAKIKQRNEASKEVLSGLKNLAKGNFITGTSQLVSGSNKATKITKKEVPKPKRYTAETVCTTRPTPIPSTKCNEATQKVLNFISNASKHFTEKATDYINATYNQVQKLFNDPGQFFTDAWEGIKATISDPKFWTQTAVAAALAVATGGQSIWVQAIVTGSGYTMTGEGYDFAGTGFDVEKFYELKGVDNAGEYWGGALFDCVLSSGDIYVGRKAFEYVKGGEGS